MPTTKKKKTRRSKEDQLRISFSKKNKYGKRSFTVQHDKLCGIFKPHRTPEKLFEDLMWAADKLEKIDNKSSKR